jgi:plasmid stabilization system protein ParE
VYIGGVDLKTSRRWLDELDDFTLRICEFPKLRTPVGNPRSRTYRRSFRLTTVAYRVHRKKIEIIRVPDSRQDVGSRTRGE